MPPIIYECAVTGEAFGEEIINVLYYANLSPTNNGWDPARASALGEAVGTAWFNNAKGTLPTQYTLQSVKVRGLDYNRNVVSTYTIEVPASGAGTRSFSMAGAGPVGIIAFQTGPAAEFEAERVPRRSYIAIGPLTDAQVMDDGKVLWSAQEKTDLTALLTQGHLAGGVNMVPVRLGVPNSLGQPAIGAVDGVLFRPFASFRRSRMVSPKGS